MKVHINYMRRRELLWQMTEPAGIKSIILTPGPDMYYFTGLEWIATSRPIMAMISSSELCALVIPELEATRVANSLPQETKVFTYSDETEPLTAIKAAVKALNLSRAPIGINYAEVKVLDYFLLRTAAPQARVINVQQLLLKLRAIKDSAEIEFIKKAVDVAEAAVQNIIARLTPEVTEVDIRQWLYSTMLTYGAQDLAFEPIVLFGPRTALQHERSTKQPLCNNDVIIIDCGAKYKYYVSDITRTFAYGKVCDVIATIHRVAWDALNAAFEKAAPGVPAGELDRVARSVIQKAGYGDFFIHRTGHGVGLEIHEMPYIAGNSQDLLVPGMVFTLEPGIYLPGIGGVRIEDMVLICDSGAVMLTRMKRDLNQLRPV